MSRTRVRLTQRGRNLLTFATIAATGAALGFILTLCYQIGTQR